MFSVKSTAKKIFYSQKIQRMEADRQLALDRWTQELIDLETMQDIEMYRGADVRREIDNTYMATIRDLTNEIVKLSS